MEYLDSIILVVTLFLLGVISPGPNFFAVTHQSLHRGFKAGAITGLGIALGDLLYAGVGLFGLAAVITSMGWLFTAIKFCGGAYLVYLGINMIIRNKSREPSQNSYKRQGSLRAFRFGLITDLANPKTIIFFASIFATTIRPDMPKWVLWMMLLSIGVTSIGWRLGLSYCFSRNILRSIYQRFRKWIEWIFGGFLILFGSRLAVDSFQSK